MRKIYWWRTYRCDTGPKSRKRRRRTIDRRSRFLCDRRFETCCQNVLSKRVVEMIRRYQARHGSATSTTIEPVPHTSVSGSNAGVTDFTETVCYLYRVATHAYMDTTLIVVTSFYPAMHSRWTHRRWWKVELTSEPRVSPTLNDANIATDEVGRVGSGARGKIQDACLAGDGSRGMAEHR